MEERIISFHLYIPQLLPLSVSEEGVGYGKKDSRMILEELREKSFMSDSLFKIGMSHGRAMAEYIARTVTGCPDIEIERVLTEYEVENIGHSVRLDALAIGPDGECYDFEVQNARNRVYDRYRITSLRQVNHAQTVGLGQSGKGSRTDSCIQQTALQALSHLNRALPIP